MAETFQAVRGMNDLLPAACARWRQAEAVLRQTAESFGYAEIRLPLLERAPLFTRAIGEVTDVVEKEMYVFEDSPGEQLALRPEGTAGCVRACLEHGLLGGQEQRLWYMGPMFRHERPQQGRYRQFHQLGVEAFGLAGPDIDAELIVLSHALWRRLGVEDCLTLQLNTLGSGEERAAYRRDLVDFLERHAAQLDEDSRRRTHRNPLRVLDSKNPQVQEVLTAAPQLLSYLGRESQAHFEGLQHLLEAAGIAYELNPHLVRGLDYYNLSVFEWVTTQLGAQGTVCGGGRYDTLVGLLGGAACPAAGFALGLERLMLLLEQHTGEVQPPGCEVYIMAVCEEAALEQMRLAQRLRAELPGVSIVSHCGGGGFRRQFRRADRSGARVGVIIGEDERRSGQAGFKDLHDPQAPQQRCAVGELAGRIRALLGHG